MILYKQKCVNCDLEIISKEDGESKCLICEQGKYITTGNIRINNLTLNPVTFETKDDAGRTVEITVEPCGKVTKSETRVFELDEYYPLQVFQETILGVNSLPDAKENVYYILPQNQARLVPNRTDVLFVNNKDKKLYKS